MTGLAAALKSLELPGELKVTLSYFKELFMKWNRSINLSAARSSDDLELHIVDSLHAVPPLRDAADLRSTLRVLDVGSGGGLPAVVVAIALPAVQVTALEPVHKKQAFLRAAARELSLQNLEPRAERIEAHGHRDYDAAMSRATFDLREWLDLGLGYVLPGGLVLGFEAMPRSDLPPAVERAYYVLSNRARSIVTLRRPTP